MMTVDERIAKVQSLEGQEAKDYIRHLLEDEVWYTGGDICSDCAAHERWTGEDGIPTGILVAHDTSCPWFNGVTR